MPDLLKWDTLRICEGEKGPIVAGFARMRVYTSADRTPASERWLLLRNDPNTKIKYALSNAAESCPLSELVRVSQARWPIERCFQENKGELGMDHYEHRSWTAWHRHMRLNFLAQLFLVRLRLRLKKKVPALTLPRARQLLSWSFSDFRRDLIHRIEIDQYYALRNDRAYRSHRKRRLKELATWSTLSP